MSAIEASFVKVAGTLSDGTLRIVFDVEPRYAKDAFAMFNMPGTRAALAALLPDHFASVGNMVDKVEAFDKPKGGALSKLAGMWCADENFYLFIVGKYDLFMGGNGTGMGDLNEGMTYKEISRHAILVMCDIESRAELDHDLVAAEKFNRLIRNPYTEYLKG